MDKDALWSLCHSLDTAVGLPAPADPGATDAVFVYHSIGSLGGDAVAPATFRRHLARLTDRFDVVDLPAVLEPASRRRVAVTFDDGFADFYRNALPVVEEFGAPVTLFVSAGLLDDRRPAETARRHRLEDPPDPAMLTAEQTAELADHPLVTLGNHTLTHANLSDVPDRETVRHEIVENKRQLEDRFGVSVDRFSYPYHGMDDRARGVVADTHDVAACGLGLVDGERGRYRLPRVSAARSAFDVEWAMSAVPETLRAANRAVFK